jgi:hypothetical protein
MKGKSPTKEEQQYWNDLVEVVGCVVSRLHLDIYNDYCSIHHIVGRTKKNAHKLVLPLSARFHQEQTGDYKRGIYAVHPYKARFEREYGSQMYLLTKCNEMLIEAGKHVPDLEP